MYDSRDGRRRIWGAKRVCAALVLGAVVGVGCGGGAADDGPAARPGGGVAGTPGGSGPPARATGDGNPDEGPVGDGGGPSGDGGGSDDVFPGPPNTLRAGDGTAGSGGTVVYDGKTSTINAINTGCGDGARENQYAVQIWGFGGGFGSTKVWVLVSLPKDKLTGSRVFDVGPAPAGSYAGVTHAAVLQGGGGAPEVQAGSGGKVWVKIDRGIAEVRFEGIPLADASGAPTGKAVSGALLCGAPVS